MRISMTGIPAIILSILIIVGSIFLCIKVVEEVNDTGLKNILTTLWEGENNG